MRPGFLSGRFLFSLSREQPAPSIARLKAHSFLTLQRQGYAFSLTRAGRRQPMETAMKRSLIVEFICEDRGATSIEYALIAGIVSTAIVLALTQISSSLQSSLYAVSGMFSSASN